MPYPQGLEESREFVRRASTGPSRTSILEDICFYWVHHAPSLNSMEDDPTVATIFLKKIAAANWIHLADYFRASAHKFEHHFSLNESFDVFAIKTQERWWADLHLWHRRCIQHCEDVHDILISLRISPNFFPGDTHNVMDSSEDFVYIYKQLKWTASRFEMLIQSATALNDIAGNKEAVAQNLRETERAHQASKISLQEARKSSVLTLLATVFVPLAVTAGIFSMSDDWAPGGDKFRYYWVITLPIVFLIAGGYFWFGRAVRNQRVGENGGFEEPMADLEKGDMGSDSTTEMKVTRLRMGHR